MCKLANFLAVLRLLYAAVCLLLALLAVLPAPTNLLWRASILVTELGWVLAGLALLVFLPGWRGTRAGRIAAAGAVAAAVLALSPLVRAVPAARQARTGMAHAFSSDAGSAPFRLVAAFVGVSHTPVEPTTHEYARHGTVPLLLDFYPPAQDGAARPLVVVIHGGSWRSGDRRQISRLNSQLAQRGYAVAAIEYRLAPQHIFPAALEDVGAASQWLKGHAQRLGIDSSNMVLLGRSAGGHLALLAAYTLDDPGIRGAVSFYGPTDLRWGWQNPGNPRVVDTHAILRGFLGGTLAERGEAFDRASPLQYTTSAVPTLLIHGDRDEVVSRAHSVRLAEALRARGIPHAHVHLPWATHACDYIARGPCGQISTWAVEQFLMSVLGPQRPGPAQKGRSDSPRAFASRTASSTAIRKSAGSMAGYR